MANEFRRLVAVLGAVSWLAFLVFVVLYGAGISSKEANADAAELAPQAWWSLSQSAMPSYVSANASDGSHSVHRWCTVDKLRKRGPPGGVCIQRGK